MQLTIVYGLLGITFSLLSGCSTGKEAQLLALATLSQTLQYENAINAKIAAEKTYYRDIIEAISTSMERSQAVSQLTIIDRWAQSVQRKIAIAKRDLDSAELTEYLDTLLQTVSSSRTAYLSARKQYNDDLQQALLQLQREKSSLAQVIRGLQQLQAGPSDSKQFRLWFEFAAEVKDGMESGAVSALDTAPDS